MTDAFKFMLQVDVVRGPDSTGVIAVRKDGVHTLKNNVLPQDLFMDKEFDSVIGHRVIDNYILVGHNRKATRGAISIDNAHPFMHGNIVLAHNGTLTTDINVDGTKFATDSEGICYAIDRKGISWAWKNLNGSASLIWYDNRSDKVNILTNGKRPLFFGYTSDKKHVLIASEIWMIEATADRYKLELEKNTKGDNAIKYPLEHHMFQFKWDSDKKHVEHKARKLEEWTPKVVSYLPNKNTPWAGVGLSDWKERDSFRKRKEFDQEYFFDDFGNWIGGDSSRAYENRQERIHGSATEKSSGKHYNTAKDLGIPEETFKTAYSECHFCSSSTVEEYTTAIIIDDSKVCCDSCATTAMAENMDLHHAAKAL
jgi:predicted glutamine amidotransferase